MFQVSIVEVWAATIDDRPGGLNAKLQALATAGADLEFVIARRQEKETGKGVVYITGLEGPAQTAAAEKVGFKRAFGEHSLRVEGMDEPGVAYLLTRALAEKQINLRGISAATIRGQFVMYLNFDSQEDTLKAIERLKAPV